MIKFTDYISPTECLFLIQQSKDEDMGHKSIDLTSEIFINPNRLGKAVFTSRKPGKLCGSVLLKWIAQIYDPSLEIEVHLSDGDTLKPNAKIATVTGPLQSLF